MIPAKPRLLLIDALRGFAAFWVVVFHVRVDLWVGWKEIQVHPEAFSWFDRLVAWLSLPCYFGGSGVMLFFLVSGFCVHLPQVGKMGSLNIGTYVLRRFLRIYPPYLAAVGLTFVCAWLAGQLGLSDKLGRGGHSWSEILLMAQNYGQGQPAANPSLWSLPVEVELYVAYIFLHAIARRTGWFVVTLGVAAVSILASIWGWRGQMWVYGNFLHFWLIWSGGIWLATWWSRQMIPVLRAPFMGLGGGLLVLAIWARLADMPFVLQNYLWAGFYFLLFWWTLTHAVRLDQISSPVWRALVWIGGISYSLYLIHYPIFYLVGALWQRIWGGKPANFLVPVAVAFLILPLAWLFWWMAERPAHEWARRLTGRRTAGLGDGK